MDAKPLATQLPSIQGLLIRGYSDLHAAAYVLLQVQQPALCKKWLQSLAKELTRGDNKHPVQAINLAFTHGGLQALNLSGQTLGTFSREFVEGMTDPYRQRLLGDSGEDAPEHWDWGYQPEQPIHLMLMLFAKDDAELNQFYQTQEQQFTAHGVSLVRRLNACRLDQEKEHFGFHDGISQPIIPGLSKVGPAENTVKVGEFILGYENEYDKLPDSPTAYEGPVHLLEGPDFGRNGSYLVFRQISQDVPRFWRFMQKATQQLYKSDQINDVVRLAAKMVGRWPNGASLVDVPEHVSLEGADNRNEFSFHKTDALGMKCPLGSHIRRTNPRDGLGEDPVESVKIAKRHRILRRGRSYGQPYSPDMDPAKLMQEPLESQQERGLFFIGFNTNLSRQFEFIQHTWINNQKFSGLYTEADPLIGPRQPGKDCFVIQKDPIRERVNELERFVTMRGGAYFFMPSIQAVAYLAALP